jgi:probable O-glycosylation ligase (exosortase A-associated)
MFDARRTIGKIWWVSVLLFLVVAIVTTKSRGGTVALAAMGFYYWLKSERKVMTASVFAAMLATILVVAPPSYFERMGTITDTEESSAAGRITAWTEGVKMAARNPLLGAGVGHFPVAYGASNGGRWMTAHSIYFLVLGELALPGITLLLSIIIANLVMNARLMRQLPALPRADADRARNLLMGTSAAMIAFASGGAFLSAAYYPHMYVLCGLCGATRYLVREQVHAAGEVPAAPGVGLVPVNTVTPPVTTGHISPEWRPRPGLSAGLAAPHRG